MLVLVLFFKVFEHEIVWIQIRSYPLYCQFAGPDLDLNCMQNLPVDETIVDTRDFAGPDLDLNRLQNFPVDETFVDTCDFPGPDLDLNRMQYLPVDETIVDKEFKHWII